MFILLGLQIFYGLLMESSWLRSVVRLDTSFARVQHAQLFQPIFVIIVAHIVTALLHDLKSQTGEVSSMINGHKYFTFNKNSTTPNIDVPTALSIDELFSNAKFAQIKQSFASGSLIDKYEFYVSFP